MIELTIFTVATGRYLDFWIQLVKSGEEYIGNSVKTQWLVLTDQGGKIPKELVDELGPRLSIVSIDHELWPYPTLKRYEYLLSARDQIVSEYVMHLDADMIFIDSINEQDITKPLAHSEIACVSHPGYFRPKGFKLFFFYLKNPRRIFQDVSLLLKFGGVGTWERNSKSTAFVERPKRNIYVCGGCWFGNTGKILQMALSLERNVNIDLENGLIANFHDESHLNSFVSSNDVNIITPEFCFEPKYPQLRGLRGKILAVDKNVQGKWLR